jgi:hypothetical protein
MPIEKYGMPPKRVFRAMGLGVEKDGYIPVVAGFGFRWRDPIGRCIPIVVKARVLRRREQCDACGGALVHVHGPNVEAVVCPACDVDSSALEGE